MDAYAYILEQLRENDHRRLRSFAGQPASDLAPWLTVVAKRLCIDHHRRIYGRRQSAAHQRTEFLVRRRLNDLSGQSDSTAMLIDSAHDSSADMVERSELSIELGKLVSALPASDRELLLYRFARGMSGDAIARRLGLPSTFHAYRRINSVLGRLKAGLMRRGFDGSIA